MPAWHELVSALNAQPDSDKSFWLASSLVTSLNDIRTKRNDRNVIFYSSAFLQKPSAAPFLLQITFEDLNGFMTAIHALDCSKGLTLVLHTPGGVTNAAESIVSYLGSKFTDIEVIIPAYAMSAGTMISLAANRIIMGRQSQLGPIDPQMAIGGAFLSARSLVDQFELAKQDILGNAALAHVWAPILASIGPALLQEARNALDYSERMVATWLADRMFKAFTDPVAQGKTTAAHFNDAATHKSHGRRIDREEARANAVAVEDLETDQSLQDAVLTAYHLITLLFENGPASKCIWTHANHAWLKNIPQQP